MRLRLQEFRDRAGLSQDEVAAQLKIHPVNYNKWENGHVDLSIKRLRRLADIFSCRPEELIADIPDGVVQVRGIVQAGFWTESQEWPAEDRYVVSAPSGDDLVGKDLFAVEVRGNSMDRVFAEGTILICSAFRRVPEALRFGRHYIIERIRADGLHETTVKTVLKDSDGKLWLAPQSDDPRFSEAIPVASVEGDEIRIVGRVYRSIRRE